MTGRQPRFESIAAGFVTQRPVGPAAGAIAVGARCALAANGELLCSCMVTAALGTNDFVPLLFRSRDLGITWHEEGPLWPELSARWSIFASVSRDSAGNLFAFGSRSPIDVPGEPFWCDATQGIKQNELIWSRSDDAGHSWSSPAPIPMPVAGSAEAPGALCVTRTGRWIAPYSPYNTFDPAVTVDRSRVLAVISDDQGRNWSHATMLDFRDASSGGAEAWLVELTDGRLLGAGWRINLTGEGDHPNAFAVSKDGGTTWQPTSSTGILGQSIALAADENGRALFIYNQRKHGDVGVWLAEARPTDSNFGIESNELIWRADRATQSGTSAEHNEWEDFSFGEPSITVLPDKTLLATMWCVQPSGSGIRYVKLRRID